MRQSRRMSLVEAVANVVVGYAVAVLTQIIVFPLFGLQVSLVDNLAIGVAFTAISLARSFVLRRVFEAIRVRAAPRRSPPGMKPGGIGHGEGSTARFLPKAGA